MRIMGEYRVQAYLVVLQSILIVIGSTAVTGLMKAQDRMSPHDEGWPLPLRFIRTFGLSLLIVPPAWAFLTIQLERSAATRFRRRWTVATGFLLLLTLALLYATSIGFALFPARLDPIRTL